jgi:hypothetical protein
MARVVERRRTAVRVENVAVTPSVFGKTWYVDGTNGAAGNTGLDPLDAFASVASARAASAAGDTIVIAPGSYTVDVGTAGLAPKANQTWMAARPANGGAPSVIFTQDADDDVDDLVSVDVDGVTFEGIEFRLVAGGTTALYLVAAAQTTAVRGLRFVDCWFNLNGVDAAVIACRFNDATNAITGLSMQRCRFIGGTGTTSVVKYVQVGIGGIPDALVEDCVFVCASADGDCAAFDFLDPGAAAKSYAATIRNNDFIGPSDGGGDVAPIVVAAAATEDEIVAMIRTNYFSNCSATPATQDKINNSLVNNYVGDNATGGTLVDPGT